MAVLPKEIESSPNTLPLGSTFVRADAIQSPLARTQMAPAITGGKKTIVLAAPARPNPLASTVLLPLSSAASRNRGAAASKVAAPNVTMLLRPPAVVSPRARTQAGALAGALATPAVVAAPVVSPFDVELVENLSVTPSVLASSPTQTRYRDAISFGNDQALLLMTDFAGLNRPIASELLRRWQNGVRSAAVRGAGADAILQLMNHELLSAGLEATATCARLDLRERLVDVASAGAAGPFVIRSSERVVRVRTTASVALGRVRAARFCAQSLHFDRADTLILPSNAWVTVLERLFAQPIDLALRTVGFALREQRAQPLGSALLRLTVR